VFDQVGALDEWSETATVEDDYARRVRDAGYRVVYDEGLFVHRFGDASLASADDRRESADAAMYEPGQQTDARAAEGGTA
jgi:hypothetical protein